MRLLPPLLRNSKTRLLRSNPHGGHVAPSPHTGEATMAETLYARLKALATVGIMIRRATHFEEQRNEYGEKCIWVIDRGGNRQAGRAYRTKEEALQAAEAYR